MPASTRIKATNIKFLFGATEYSCDATMVELTLDDAPGDVQTFCEVRAGGQWTLNLEGLTSGDAASLYRVLWTAYGTEGTFTVAPQGNAVGTATAPIYQGTVVFDQLPPLSLTSNEIVKFSVSLTVKAAVHTPATTPPVYYGLTVKTAA
jgi:hypothetical protein